MRLNYGRTFLLGLGFMATSVFWSVYDTFLPPMYDQYVGSTFLVGVVMTIDNWLALLLQPWVGARSDRTWNRFGRRLPFIMIGMPLAGLLLFAVPFAHSANMLWFLLCVTVLMNIGMAISRTPTVSLMPDITPPQHRSAANGIINLMGGVGAGVALFLAAPLKQMNEAYPFFFAAAVIIIMPFLLKLFIKEPQTLPHTASDDGEEGVSTIVSALRGIWQTRDRSGVFLLIAIFAWFIGFAGAQSLFSLYGERVLGIDPSVAAGILLFLVATVVVFALPAGFIGQRIGRRNSILIGLALFGAMFIAISPLRDPSLFKFILPIGGIGWSLIVVNSLPMVLELGRGREAGAYTGVYYVASMLASIAGPPLLGFLMDRLGDTAMFPACAVAIGCALLLMLNVKRGEAVAPAADTDAA